jgi:hypothetical protein
MQLEVAAAVGSHDDHARVSGEGVVEIRRGVGHGYRQVEEPRHILRIAAGRSSQQGLEFLLWHRLRLRQEVEDAATGVVDHDQAELRGERRGREPT